MVGFALEVEVEVKSKRGGGAEIVNLFICSSGTVTAMLCSVMLCCVSVEPWNSYWHWRDYCCIDSV